jgi:hypothetical protein
VIQWWRSTIPSNSLASVHGLLATCAEQQALGPDVDIDIEAYDECNTVINAGRRPVQPVSPRARYRAPVPRRGMPVVIGGFHVSGCLSMLPELPPT